MAEAARVEGHGARITDEGIAKLRAGASASPESLAEECRKHIARYKVPKHFILRERVERGPSGKADYAWARTQVAHDDA